MKRMIGVGLLLCYLGLLNVAATQGLAYFYGYHPALGSPFAGHFYAPWDWFRWQHRYFASEKNLYSAIYALAVPGRIKDSVTRGIIFIDRESGEAAFLVTPAGVEGKPPEPAALAQYEKVMAMIKGLPPICPAK